MLFRMQDMRQSFRTRRSGNAIAVCTAYALAIQSVIAGVGLGLSAAAAQSAGLVQSADKASSLPAHVAQNDQPTAPAAQPGEATNAAPVPYMMTMGDLMNTLVQPRHAKLGLAGDAGNWPLAAYALVEIRQAFAGIVKAQPRFRSLPVAELVDAALHQPMSAVETAIRQKDSGKFAVAYDQLTQGCNACHASVDHPFVVIKRPDASTFQNQDFSVGR
jgi:hypothetical protein